LRLATTVVGGMSRHRSGVVAISVCAGLLVAACGEDEAPRPDREEIRGVVVAFFDDAASGDVEALCGALTGVGRAQAAGRGSITGGLPEPATERRCVERKARTATGSVDLPLVISRDLVRVKKVRISGDSARVVVCNVALCRPQRLRKTDDGWKIESFQLPVND
jgi:hypothetical protein